MGISIEQDSGLIQPARLCLSPNRDPRPAGTPVDLIVVHNISLPPGEYGGPWIDDLFMNRLDPAGHPYFEAIHALQVSAHLLIRRDGELVQYVPFHERAWHAGASCYQGRERCNDYSIGIELEGSDEVPYSDQQYRRLAEVVDLLERSYPAIDRNRLTGHATIAPGRKSDPGPAFDWSRLVSLLELRRD